MDGDLSGEEGFEAFFRSALPAARRAAGRVLGPGGDVDDVAAEALARALARWPRLHDQAHREAWVVRVAVNLSLDRVRRRRPRFDLAVVPDPAEAATSTIVLAAALAGLPRRQREVLALRYLGGLTEREIAGVLGVSGNTVKRHTSRALGALRVELGSSWEEPRAV